jgi:uncharacterized membrane protein YdjX (TVP38/TMEM64 family)
MTGDSEPGGSERDGRFGVVLLSLIAVVAVTGLVWMTVGGGALWMTGQVRGIEAYVLAHRWSSLALFGVLTFLIQLAALPGGTIAVLSGGFLFGAPLAAGVYFLAQVCAAPVVYAAVRLGLGPNAGGLLSPALMKRLPTSLTRAMAFARQESVLAVIVFRLAPVLTSTFVPALSAVLGLPLRALIAGSLLVSWIKPSITASIGAAARSLTEVTDPKLALANAGIAPVLMVFAAAIALLVVRSVVPRDR